MQAASEVDFRGRSWRSGDAPPSAIRPDNGSAQRLGAGRWKGRPARHKPDRGAGNTTIGLDNARSANAGRWPWSRVPIFLPPAWTPPRRN